MSDGKALQPFWYDGSMNGTKYKIFLMRKVFPTLDTSYGKGNHIWTQDETPAQRCNAVQQ